jgi:hypothetical protein
MNFDVNMPEKLKFHLSVQPEFQTTASYKRNLYLRDRKSIEAEILRACTQGNFQQLCYSFHSPVLTIKRFKLPITYGWTQIAAFS